MYIKSTFVRHQAIDGKRYNVYDILWMESLGSKVRNQ